MPRGRWHVSFKTPEEELDEFLAARPSWAQKYLQANYSAMTQEELSALFHVIEEQQLSDDAAEFQRLCRRAPARWREYCKRYKENLLQCFMPSGLPGPGATRKDALAEEATLLRRVGKSYQEIADLLNQRHGPDTTNPDAVRKLISSRKPKRKPEKT